jgi:antitoxin (DNA-binding transcriptional repressor) of toxin-antitoxin stability system
LHDTDQLGSALDGNKFFAESARYGFDLTTSSQIVTNDHMEGNMVGARELKTRRGTYLRRIREGRTFVVTHRGEPVAELRPLPSYTGVPAALLRLSGKRAVTLPIRTSMLAFPMIKSRGRVLSEAVLEEREERF